MMQAIRNPLSESRVLVVEDDPMQRRLVQAAVSKLGCVDILQAADGNEALARVAEARGPVDLAICDLHMAGMDGIELLRHLGEGALVRDVIVMSAADRSVLQAVESLARHTGLAVLGHIEKPVTRDKIASCLGKRAPTAVPRSAQASFSDDEIRAGLDAREFEPFFQPKIALADGAIAGVEALARWRHPVQGLVAPGRFIAQAETSGLIATLTWQMVEASLVSAKRWRGNGLAVSVAVNLSPALLADIGVADRIVELSDRIGVDPRQVTFEVTESMATKDMVPLLSNLTRLRIRHFGVSIDDFGTGYANLEQLGRIPFTELKVDRAFVAGALKDPSARAILESSLLLGRRFGLTTVAEGVETADELDLLRGLPCDLVQGFFFAKPMAGADFEGWAAERTASAA